MYASVPSKMVYLDVNEVRIYNIDRDFSRPIFGLKTLNFSLFPTSDPINPRKPGRFGPGSFRPESFRPGSFQPILGVGRFGLGRWVVSANFPG